LGCLELSRTGRRVGKQLEATVRATGDLCHARVSSQRIAQFPGESINEALIALAETGEGHLYTRFGSLLCDSLHSTNNAARRFFRFMEGRECGPQTDFFRVTGVDPGHECRDQQI